MQALGLVAPVHVKGLMSWKIEQGFEFDGPLGRIMNGLHRLVHVVREVLVELVVFLLRHLRARPQPDCLAHIERFFDNRLFGRLA